MKILKFLREKDPGSILAFHLQGMVDAGDNIREHLESLGETYASDDEATAERLVDLRIEIYTHLDHHMKELKDPFSKWIDSAYEQLPDLDEDTEL